MRSIRGIFSVLLVAACLLAPTLHGGESSAAANGAESSSHQKAATWQTVWMEGFDGPAGVLPAGMIVEPTPDPTYGPWNSAYQDGQGRLVAPMWSHVVRDQGFNFPSGTRVKVTASLMMPSSQGNLASVWARHDGWNPLAEFDIIESAGPTRYTQIATHQCWTNHPGTCDATPAQATWTRSVIDRFSKGAFPWQVFHEYEIEFTVASAYDVYFRARDGAGNYKYNIAHPNQAVLRVQANRDFKIRVINKYDRKENVSTRPYMLVDWIRVSVLQ